jgi:adenylate cyclase
MIERLRGLAVAALALALGWGLMAWPPARRLLGGLEARVGDQLLQMLPAQAGSADSRIVIVDIDARAVGKRGRFHSWTRRELAALVDTLARQEAAALVLDLLLDPSLDAAGDSALAQAVRRSGLVVAGVEFAATDSAAFQYPDTLAARSLAAHALRAAAPLPGWSQDRLLAGLPGLAEGAAALGFVNARPDPDGLIRRAPLLVEHAGRWWPSLALAALPRALGWQGLAARRVESGLELRDPGGTETRLVPVDGDGNLRLRFRGPWRSLRTVSFHDVASGRLPEGFLRGRTVFLGSSLAGLGDLKPMPLQPAFPGVEIQATVLSNLLAEDALRPAGRGLHVAILAAAALLGVLAFSRRGLLPGLALLGLGLGTCWLAGLLALALGGPHVPVILPQAVLLLSSAGMLVQRLRGEERQRRFLAGAFSRYVGPELLEELVRHPERLRLGGERRRLTLLFCDIRGFTTLSERVPPAELGPLLNRYLTEMSHVVLEQGGTLDKYIGDAVVALFGAPVPQEDHARRALAAARGMNRRLVELRAAFAGTVFQDLEIGVGVHTGAVLVGNFGSDLHFNYTAMGDAMNLASRLEGLTKSYRCRILVSRETLEEAGGACGPHRLVDQVRVMGKQNAVDLHELLEESDPAREASYEAGRARYATGDFEAAQALLARHLGQFPDDGPAAVLEERCRLLAGRPREGWDGVWIMDRK